MNDLNKILLVKKSNNYDEINSVYIIIRGFSNYLIVKKYDTITHKESIIALDNSYVEDNLYSLDDFFNTATYVGKSGYYEKMNEVEKYMNKSYILVYKNEYNEILYDTILNNFFISPSIYPIEFFNPYKNQENLVKFKKGLGKNILK